MLEKMVINWIERDVRAPSNARTHLRECERDESRHEAARGVHIAYEAYAAQTAVPLQSIGPDWCGARRPAKSDPEMAVGHVDLDTIVPVVCQVGEASLQAVSPVEPSRVIEPTKSSRDEAASALSFIVGDQVEEAL